ncbi:MAG: hypothetical protein NTX25_04870 [Proteobacteria bacterium]|nr:hypothetical protein [Pseudomonadota bacterium]
MLGKIAIMLVLHVIAMGVLIGRYYEFLRIPNLARIMFYFLVFHILMGILFMIFPAMIIPE